MRRLPLFLLVLAPMLAFSCAQGNRLSRNGDYAPGDGDPDSNWGGEGNGENEPDPGSPDPGAPGDNGEQCVHDPCTVGEPLSQDCDPCVFDACAQDPYCCQGEWDDTCISMATSCGCGMNAGAGGSDPGVGGSDPGGEGGSHDGGVGGSDPGIGGSDPGIGGSDPGGLGGSDPGGDGGICVHEICLVGEALDASCDPCVAAVCEADDYCCSVEWDPVCLVEAIETCPENCL